ncbi:response regulator transcription factor [Saccharothrix violaceirubra]|uniref:DNA-binding NarL/FixJ family response regulator n=1 Tax=Saccharothrix violaceirubra TaxID=413306 RepID=A0A7W7WVY6_9PSEU|nr:response regulator transcription factor [Saccharothrix violaceirubra]MBB4965566.1 DNA-binding NarL/FixJ family response regulator [Saccharothrix violaceirubra]
MNPDPIRVLVADDQAIVREGLVLVLGLLPGIQVVATAADGREAVRRVAESTPDVVLMDLRMPVLDGVEATRLVLDAHPAAKVLVLTTYADEESVVAALRAGAHGYLTKDAHADTIADAIAAVLRGDTPFDPAVTRHLVTMATSGRQARLTDRETEVLRLIALGLSNAEIARQLYVTEATVKTHVNNLFAKTGVRDRAQAVIYAYRHHLVVPPA